MVHEQNAGPYGTGHRLNEEAQAKYDASVQGGPVINLARLEAWMLIAHDVRLEFSHNKNSGEWSWYDRGYEEILYGPHPTFYDALHEAIEPYIKEDEENV